MTPTSSPLKRLRLEKGYKTVKAVERLTGLTGLGAVEARKAPITEKIYTALAQLYEVPVRDII